uniref:COX15/CtaA family protein n=1 Tax=Candidatus Planktophila sp. TaxID=2175601 RepID=UPI00404A6D36
MKSRRALYGLLLFLQSALVLTGGAVRLTGSGLGCPTWPECTPGSYTPVPNQAEGQLHAWIEFGNRLLTFALVAVALAVLVHVLYKQRRDLRLLALAQVLGIFGQGILGGITVLTQLHPLTVAAHLLLSILLIGGATSLYDRREIAIRKIKLEDKMTSNLSLAHIYLTFFVIVLGTLVTGSGPHAGDEDTQRLGFDIRTVAWIHAEAVIALLGLTLALYVAARQNPLHRRKIIIFTFISLAQGAIGYVQYFMGIPEIIVALHLLGATLVWI